MDIQLFNVDHVKLTEEILDAATPAMEVMADIGKVIGSIFLIIVVFAYVSSILEGGKFQLKMLIPLLIYLCVCNFKFVAGPIVKFANLIQSESIEACKKVDMSYINKMTGDTNAESSGAVSILKLFLNFENVNDPPAQDEVPMLLDNFPDSANEVEYSETSGEGTPQESSKHFSFKGIASNIGNALLGFLKYCGTKTLEAFNFPLQLITRGVMGMVAVVIDWVCELLQIALASLGSVMTAVVVTFGPLTWAFAVFPGNGRTITAWIIRLCQFALYAPIVALLRCFFIVALYTFSNSMLAFGDAGSFYSAIGLVLALIASLMSVPAIASMIIEGAQGAVTLSQGIMTATNIMQAGGAMQMKNVAESAAGNGGSSSGGGSGSPTPPPGGGGGTGMAGGVH